MRKLEEKSIKKFVEDGTTIFYGRFVDYTLVIIKPKYVNILSGIVAKLRPSFIKKQRLHQRIYVVKQDSIKRIAKYLSPC